MSEFVNTVDVIGDDALTDSIIDRTIIEIADNIVDVIGNYAFNHCSSLTSVEFPVCTSIGDAAFSGCSSLTSVSFPACTTIGVYAFRDCSSLTNASFQVCTSIGAYAFYNCSSLTNASFQVCTSIGGSAFVYCRSLTTANFPMCTRIGNSAFSDCSSLTSVDFPVCTSIGSSAFLNCSGLTTVNFPVCTSIGNYAFNHCYSLTSANFPVCTRIGNYAFNHCSSLTSVEFPVCTSIGDAAFSGCSSLTSVSFPACTSISNYAFSACSSLTSVSFPACTSIGAYAFRDCSNLTSIEFPRCKSIGETAFYVCTSLTSVDFPVCTNIGNNAFAGCSSLASVNFPECTTIGIGAFGNCFNLTNVNFPECTNIGNNAFYSCSSLTSVSFPVCTSIGTSAFYNCVHLMSIYLAASITCTLLSSDIFNRTPIAGGTGNIFVPASLVDAYKVASNWSYFSSVIHPIEGYTVTWVNADGTVLETDTGVQVGETPTYNGSTPVDSVNGYEWDGWTPAVAPVNSDVTYTATFKDAWSEVAAAIEDGTYKTKYAIGDTVALDLGSEGIINMQIAAFDADTLADGSGTAAISWVAKELLATSQRMNAYYANGTEGSGTVGGWEKCEMRSYLQGTVKPLVPSGVAGMIRSVAKTQDAYDTSNNKFVQTTFDDLFIPSKAEVLDQSGIYAELFQNDASRIKHKHGASDNSMWWLRSAQSIANFDGIGSSGSSVSYPVISSYGVCLCFCTGVTPA